MHVRKEDGWVEVGGDFVAHRSEHQKCLLRLRTETSLMAYRLFDPQRPSPWALVWLLEVA